jgi:hypothetical protein
MAKIKIFVEDGESEDSVRDLLEKALKQRKNRNDSSEQFLDPAMDDVANKLIKLHEDIIKEIIEDISQELKS